MPLKMTPLTNRESLQFPSDPMLIGLDIGTTNVKAVAFGDEGKILATAERANSTFSPEPGWSEQQPDEVLRNVLATLDEVIRLTARSRQANKPAGIVFSAAMHGLAAVDKTGQPLTNFLLWSDLRADSIAQDLRRNAKGLELYRKTGVPIHAMSPLCKLIWLRRHRPDLFRRSHKFLGIKEFVWFRLTGRYESDLSLASATGLLDLEKNDWNEAALLFAGISREQLPVLVSPSHMAQPDAVHATFHPSLRSVPLIIGASDGALANLGSGATSPGQVAITIGTSAAIRMMTHAPVTDARMRTFCYRLDEQRCIMGGASNNGTNALEWLRTAVFRSPLDAGSFASTAHQVPPGADGLLFLPYLSGERAPLYRASARGSFNGLTSAHGQAHFIRAVMEGILFNLKIIAEALDAHQPIRTLHAGGGFSRNTLWVQMLADIFQKPVLLNENDADASVSGAIQLARSVLNMGNVPENQSNKMVEPHAANAEIYQQAFLKFKIPVSEFLL